MTALSTIKPSSSRIKDIKLNILLEVTKAINDNTSREELFRRFEEVLKNQLRIGKIVLFMHDEKWECMINYGIKEKDFDIVVERDLLSFKEILYVNLNSKPHLELFDVVIPV